jgi:hypothetical protein
MDSLEQGIGLKKDAIRKEIDATIQILPHQMGYQYAQSNTYQD